MKDLLVIGCPEARQETTRRAIRKDISDRLGIPETLILVVPEDWNVSILRDVEISPPTEVVPQ